MKRAIHAICALLAVVVFLQAGAVPAFAASDIPAGGNIFTGWTVTAGFTKAAEKMNTPEPASAEPVNSLPAALPGETAMAEPPALEEEQAPREMPQYFQDDYPNSRYGTGNIATQGCSITSLAMVATYLTGHDYMPDELADYFGGKGNNNVERIQYASEALQLPFTKTYDWRDVKAALLEGDVAIVLVNGASAFTNSQHFLVLKGFNESGRVMVNDSNKANYERWNLKNGFENGFDPGAIIRGFSGAWIYHVDQMPEEPFIYVEEKPDAVYRYPEISLTWAEMELLARVVWAEARGESFEGQQAVAEVVFNRMVSEDFPDSLVEVIYGEEQFRSVPLLDKAEPSQTQYEAIEAALEGPNVLPTDVYYFATYRTNPYVWGTIDNHVFCFADPNS